MEATSSLANRPWDITPVVVAESPDEILVAGIASGDQSALSEAYRAHGASVFAAALAVSSRRELAEEITQEVFVRLWNRPERFDAARGALRSFLKIDARGRAIDALRSERSRRAREDKEARLSSSTESRSVEEIVMQHVTSRRVRELLDGLRPEERTPIALAYFDGRSYREVAKILDLPEGTVKSRIRSGLGRLKGLLASVGIEPA
jgi:RNA polymerase sigma-70 factor (ECF subfamily)